MAKNVIRNDIHALTYLIDFSLTSTSVKVIKTQLRNNHNSKFLCRHYIENSDLPEIDLIFDYLSAVVEVEDEYAAASDIEKLISPKFINPN